MLVFYIQLLLVYIFSLYARLSSSRNKILSNFFLVTVILVLFLVSGFRAAGIGDTQMYTYLYKLIGPSYSGEGYEPGFIIFLKGLKLISQNPQFMLLITSFIINVFNIWILMDYPGYFELNTFMYIASGYYLVTMNGLRQSIAAAVLFASTNLIIKGRFKAYLTIVLIMCSFHISALILIPVYFLVRKEAWSPKVYLFIFIFLIGLMIYGPIMNVIFNILGNSKFGEYKNFKEGGTNIVRVAVYFVPMALAYIKRKQLKEFWPDSNVFVNMSLLNLIVMCFALNNWIFARFSIYFQMYSFVLLAAIIEGCMQKRERNFTYICLLAAYLAFFLYEQSIALNIVYEANLPI